MQAIGPDALAMPLDPHDLLMIAGRIPEDHPERVEWEGFAHDLAVVRELPMIFVSDRNMLFGHKQGESS